eukprot:s652_g24.t1
MPIPFPEGFSSGGYMHDDAHTKRLVSLQVVTFDWLVLGRPKSAPDSLKLGNKLSARQWDTVRRLEHLSFDGNTPELVDAAGMGRRAAKVEGFEDTLHAIGRAVDCLQVFDNAYSGRPRRRDWCDGDDDLWRAGEPHGAVQSSLSSTAKPLYPERLVFPCKPAFDPRPFFDPATRDLYERPLELGISAEEAGEPPRVLVRASKENKVLLYKKMADIGLLKPVMPGTFHEFYQNGLFAVPKDGARDRMVLDGRPANMIDRGQQRWSQAMASATALAGICLPATHDLVCSGEDLRDCFYQFMVGQQRTCRNVLQGELSLSEAREIFGKSFCWPSDRVSVALSSLAMGDRNAVEFARLFNTELAALTRSSR